MLVGWSEAKNDLWAICANGVSAGSTLASQLKTRSLTVESSVDGSSETKYGIGRELQLMGEAHASGKLSAGSSWMLMKEFCSGSSMAVHFDLRPQ